MNKIAIITDAHGLLEPTKKVIEDIKKRGIDVIYSLGDNVGEGPSSEEVMQLLIKNNVIFIKGNSEEYFDIGIEPFKSYFKDERVDNYLWIKSTLSGKVLDVIKSMPHSLILKIGNKKIGLCHFINDVRCDYLKRSTWTYQRSLKYGKKNISQFKYTNSILQEIEVFLKHNKDKAYESTYKEPILNGKRISSFNYIFQGHVHFKSFALCNKTKIYTLSSVAMEHDNNAHYTIVNFDDNNINIEEISILYDRKKMYEEICNSLLPHKEKILKYTNYGG